MPILAFEAKASGKRVMVCMMRPALHGGVVIALVACVAFAAGQNVHRGLGAQDASAMDETTGSTSNRAPDQLALSDEQRGRIYESVMRIPDAPVATAHGCRCTAGRRADAGFAHGSHPRDST